MKTDTIYKMFAAIMIMAVMGWGINVFAQDLYSEGEMGIVSRQVLSPGGDDLNAATAGHAVVSPSGYCLLAPEKADGNNVVSFSEGENGIPDNFSNTVEMAGTKDEPALEVCLKTGSDEALHNSGFNYSFGEVETLN